MTMKRSYSPTGRLIQQCNINIDIILGWTRNRLFLEDGDGERERWCFYELGVWLSRPVLLSVGQVRLSVSNEIENGFGDTIAT
jgi:hypothetical protein